MVPPYSDRITRVPPYSSSSQHLPLQIRGYHPLLRAFPDPSPAVNFDVDSGLLPVRSPLLGESRLISFPRGTEMFQFPRFASFDYDSSNDSASMHWVSPFGHRRLVRFISAYRRFSQISTSFIASDCLGIHRVRLIRLTSQPEGVLRCLFARLWAPLHPFFIGQCSLCAGRLEWLTARS